MFLLCTVNSDWRFVWLSCGQIAEATRLALANRQQPIANG
jgi:hypothetical protein